MERTQIYLTKHQHNELAAIAKGAGKNQSELICEAVDRLIDQEGCSRREEVLRETAGVKGDAEKAALENFVSPFRVVPVCAAIAKAEGLYNCDYGKSCGVGLADAISIEIS